MNQIRLALIGLMCCFGCSLCIGDCPLDHYRIGCNADGIAGTADDVQLFVDCSQIYRHSDPSHSSNPTWLFWHYPMYYSAMYSRYQIGEPGFDVITDDSSRQLVGAANSDYCLWIECVRVRTGLTARNTGYGITLQQPGDRFCHSTMPESHIHLQYRLSAPAGQTISTPYWITYRVVDSLGKYEASEEFTLVFFADPLPGDVVVDGTVDGNDLMRLADYWLAAGSGYENDFYQRTDINRDGIVNLNDMAELGRYWLMHLTL